MVQLLIEIRRSFRNNSMIKKVDLICMFYFEFNPWKTWCRSKEVCNCAWVVCNFPLMSFVFLSLLDSFIHWMNGQLNRRFRWVVCFFSQEYHVECSEKSEKYWRDEVVLAEFKDEVNVHQGQPNSRWTPLWFAFP